MYKHWVGGKIQFYEAIGGGGQAQCGLRSLNVAFVPGHECKVSSKLHKNYFFNIFGATNCQCVCLSVILSRNQYFKQRNIIKDKLWDKKGGE